MHLDINTLKTPTICMLLSWILVLNGPICAKEGFEMLNGACGESQAYCKLFGVEKVVWSRDHPLDVRRCLFTARHVCDAVRSNDR